MTSSKRKKLVKAGFKVGTVQEFLGLSDVEMSLIEVKVRLIEKLKQVRKTRRITQQALARRMESSQSRVAKIEALGEGVSLDLICRALFTLGVSPREIGLAVASNKAA